MICRAVIFDLDGTLADTLGEIAAATNFALDQLGHTALPVDRYRYLAGQGIAYMVQHVLGPDHADQAERAIQFIEQYYATHQFRDVRAFPGIPELLETLRHQRIPRAVLSNRMHHGVQTIVQTCFEPGIFDAVQGEAPGIPLKPDPAGALMIAQRLNVAPEQCLYPGDTQADMLTGSCAGMFTIGVTWGFRDIAELRDNGADAIIDDPAELMELIQNQPA